MCSPASDTLNHTFTTFLHPFFVCLFVFFWILRKRKRWDDVVVCWHSFFFFCSREWEVNGTHSCWRGTQQSSPVNALSGVKRKTKPNKRTPQRERWDLTERKEIQCVALTWECKHFLKKSNRTRYEGCFSCFLIRRRQTFSSHRTGEEVWLDNYWLQWSPENMSSKQRPHCPLSSSSSSSSSLLLPQIECQLSEQVWKYVVEFLRRADGPGWKGRGGGGGGVIKGSLLQSDAHRSTH